MGNMFRLYRVIFRPSKTTDPIFTRYSSALWDPQCLHNSILTIRNHIWYLLIILANAPRASPQKNSKAWTGPLYSNSHIKTVSSSHRRVFSQHPHRAPRGRITLSPQPSPPSITIPVRSFPKAILASLIADLQPDIHTLYIFLTIYTLCL